MAQWPSHDKPRTGHPASVGPSFGWLDTGRRWKIHENPQSMENRWGFSYGFFHDSDDEQKGDNRDDMFDSKQMKDKKKVQETDSDRQKQT